MSSFWNTEEQKDENYDKKLRPVHFDSFMGQGQAKKNLKLFVQAVLERNDVLDHVFLSGPPGLGKTTLAYILSNELNVPIYVTNAPAIEKPKDLIGILSTLAPRSVLFIDEIHRLKSNIEEVLYVAMEDFKVDWIIGGGVDTRAIRIPLNTFTLVGATTQPGKVALPLHNRFGITERLQYYTETELAEIVKRSAEILKVPIEEDAAQYLGKIGRGTPRWANRLLRRMRDFAQIHGQGTINKKIIEIGSRELGIDGFGLEEIDRKIIRVLVNDYEGKPVGLKTLALAVNESPESLEDYWEQYLVIQGYIKRTSQGRKATAKAWKFIQGQDGSKDKTGLGL